MRSDSPVGWERVPLGDLVRIHHGCAFKGEFFADAPPADILLTPGNFAVGGGFSWGKRKYYRGPVDARYVLGPGDLIISMTDLSKASDTLGSPAIVPPAPAESRLLHNQRLGRVEITAPDRVQRGFLYGALRTDQYRRQIVATATGTTVKHTSPSKIGEVAIPLPPLGDQTRIAAILSFLDDKINSNRRLSTLLEETAATLFRARFVDFVGVEEFDDSPIGPIPRGWPVGKLSDLVAITMGQSPPGATYTEDQDAGVMLVQGMGGFGVRYPTSAVYTSEPTRLAGAGATLMTVRAPVGAVNVARTEVCLGRGVCGVTSHHPAHAEFLIRSLQDRWGSEESGTIFPAVNKAQVAGVSVPLPPGDEIGEFQKFAAPLVGKRALLHDESESLDRIRDALLPRLISGQIRVPDTYDPEEVVGPVAEQVAAGTP
jgi:type I restriction enzyme, S subunit